MFGGLHYIVDNLTVQVVIEKFLEHDVNDKYFTYTCIVPAFTDGPFQQFLNLVHVAVIAVDRLEDWGQVGR